MNLPTKPHIEPHTLWHWLIHTVHWGDAPTWSAAIGGAVAAVYAARAFGSQRNEIQKLKRQQRLTDRLLAYQAHANARSLIEGVAVTWTPQTDHPGRRRIRLTNQSQTAITGLELNATLGGITCMILEPALELVHGGVGPGSIPIWISPHVLSAPDSLGPVLTGTGREWTVHADNAPHDSQFSFSLRFTDEVGGRWAVDENGQARLLDEPNSETPA